MSQLVIRSYGISPYRHSQCTKTLASWLRRCHLVTVLLFWSRLLSAVVINKSILVLTFYQGQYWCYIVLIVLFYCRLITKRCCVRKFRHETFLFSELSESVIVERPRDTVSFIGDTAVLRCRANDSQTLMKWAIGEFLGTNIASSSRGVSPGYPRLSLNDSTEGQFDLIIHSTQPDDAGTYSCTVGWDPAAEAELILLGKFCWCVIVRFLLCYLGLSSKLRTVNVLLIITRYWFWFWYNRLRGSGSTVVRPPVRKYGRSFLLLVMFSFFFSTRNLRVPSVDPRETSKHDRNLCQFYKLTPKIPGGASAKKFGAKNMQNLGRFYIYTTFIHRVYGRQNTNISTVTTKHRSYLQHINQWTVWNKLIVVINELASSSFQLFAR